MYIWSYADVQAAGCLMPGYKGYIVGPFGEVYHTDSYDGNGHFYDKDGNEYDIFELIVEWNAPDINPWGFMQPMHRGEMYVRDNRWSAAECECLKTIRESYEAIWQIRLTDTPNTEQALKTCRAWAEDRIREAVTGACIGDHNCRLSPDSWKHDLGVILAGSDFANNRLRFPISILALRQSAESGHFYHPSTTTDVGAE